MINHLVVNPDLYSLMFMVYDDIDKRLELVKNNIRSVPKSKMIIRNINGRDSLIVDKNYYELAMDEGVRFLKQHNLDLNIEWVNNIGTTIPCGYYQVAVATPLDDDMFGNIKFSANMCHELRMSHCCIYDYISKTYSICLKGDNYEELVDKFNDFLTNNGIYPFIKIEVTSRYGKRDGRSYPILTKKK